ncbi:hypothetical protein GBAR_LOCUS2068, partial [Geodia barretti]
SFRGLASKPLENAHKVFSALDVLELGTQLLVRHDLFGIIGICEPSAGLFVVCQESHNHVRSQAVVAANFQRLIPPHQKFDFPRFLMSEDFQFSASPLFPLSFLVESIELGSLREQNFSVVVPGFDLYTLW